MHQTLHILLAVKLKSSVPRVFFPSTFQRLRYLSYMAHPEAPNEKLDKLRQLFRTADCVKNGGGEIQAYLLPSTDAHQNEYLAAHDFRVQFVSGFSGSNAFALITTTEALLWTDGRYVIQAKNQLENGWKLMEEGTPKSITPVDWLVENMPSNSRVGFDPKLYGYADGLRMVDSLQRVKITAVPLKENLVDILWTDRPTVPCNMVSALNSNEHGQDSLVKIEEVRKKLAKKKCTSAIFTALDDIVWLLNIRGADIPYNPLVFSILVFTPKETHLFIDTRKLNSELKQHLSHVCLHEYDDAIEWFTKWHEEERASNPTHMVLIPDATNYEFGSIIGKDYSNIGASPIQAMKAVKNDVELQGMRNSHVSSFAYISSFTLEHRGHLFTNIIIRDSAALVEFFTWLEKEVLAGRKVTEDTVSPIQAMKAVKNDVELQGMRNSHVSSFAYISSFTLEHRGHLFTNIIIRDSAALVEFFTWLEKEVLAGRKVTELSASDKSEQLRAKQPLYVGLSFSTIAGVDEHSALPHYKPTEETGTREVTRDAVFLLDSGAHYRDGTTDVTRTVSYAAEPNAELKRINTLVVKGHIKTAMMVFPDGINGIRIDVISRQHLWADGLDFSHGVGHGVGHFLNVHEGPAGIAYRRYSPEGGIHKGMILTIEPGCYLEDKWGVRFENCYEVVNAPRLRSGAENYLIFEPLTYVPVQKSLIDKTLLTQKEVEWLDAYHRACLSKVGEYLLKDGKKEEYEWLEKACSPL
uniref:Aminopeptidase P N-terminal domain-containing protein n=1 Tax=Ascaris lumbricoides TaxID=6252 RepID=A0A9J2PEC9_ASCLU